MGDNLGPNGLSRLGRRASPLSLIGERETSTPIGTPSIRAVEWQQAYQHLASFDSMMTHCSDPRDAVELLMLRERMRDWRFYDHLRTDRDAPSRKPQVGTYTPVLASDGSDLAAAIQTIREIGAAEDMDAAVADAFPGAQIDVISTDGYFELEMYQHGLLRPLKCAELSDGTLRYLLLVAALLSPRPPALMVLNEPETSLHPDLLPPLARLIVQAAKRSQAVVVSHAPAQSPRSTPTPIARRSYWRSISAKPSSATARRRTGGVLRDSAARRDARAVALLGLVRRHPGAGVALGRGDLGVRRHLGDLASHSDGIAAALSAARLNHLCAATSLPPPGSLIGSSQGLDQLVRRPCDSLSRRLTPRS